MKRKVAKQWSRLRQRLLRSLNSNSIIVIVIL
jgi:hypothetical protein